MTNRSVNMNTTQVRTVNLDDSMASMGDNDVSIVDLNNSMASDMSGVGNMSMAGLDDESVGQIKRADISANNLSLMSNSDVVVVKKVGGNNANDSMADTSMAGLSDESGADI